MGDREGIQYAGVVLKTFFINVLLIVASDIMFWVHVLLIDMVAVETCVWKFRILRASAHCTNRTFLVRLLPFC